MTLDQNIISTLRYHYVLEKVKKTLMENMYHPPDNPVQPKNEVYVSFRCIFPKAIIPLLSRFRTCQSVYNNKIGLQSDSDHLLGYCCLFLSPWSSCRSWAAPQPYHYEASKSTNRIILGLHRAALERKISRLSMWTPNFLLPVNEIIV